MYSAKAKYQQRGIFHAVSTQHTAVQAVRVSYRSGTCNGVRLVKIRRQLSSQQPGLLRVKDAAIISVPCSFFPSEAPPKNR